MPHGAERGESTLQGAASGRPSPAGLRSGLHLAAKQLPDRPPRRRAHRERQNLGLVVSALSPPPRAEWYPGQDEGVALPDLASSRRAPCERLDHPWGERLGHEREARELEAHECGPDRPLVEERRSGMADDRRRAVAARPDPVLEWATASPAARRNEQGDARKTAGTEGPGARAAADAPPGEHCIQEPIQHVRRVRSTTDTLSAANPSPDGDDVSRNLQGERLGGLTRG
jgi:hypothetical protein